MSLDTAPDREAYDFEVSELACRALWCAVIEEQRVLAVEPRVMDPKLDVLQARRWFGSKDFRMACALAGLDDDYVLFALRPQLAEAGVKV